MGYTYAIQVRSGCELKVKEGLIYLMKTMGNPGIVAIHALETFEQTISQTGKSYHRWKAKVAGYIFVTVEDSNALRMPNKVWQLIKRIPLVVNILDAYINPKDWDTFFNVIEDIEPEVKITEVKEEVYENTELNRNKGKGKEFREFTLMESLEVDVKEDETQEQRQKQTVYVSQDVLANKTIDSIVRTIRTVTKMPLSLYQILFEDRRESPPDTESPSAKKPTIVQTVAAGVKNGLLRVVETWRY